MTNNSNEPIEGESRDLVVAEPPPLPANIFGSHDPVAIVRRTTEIANALGDAIKQQGMSTVIQGNDYVLIEGWEFLGAMLNVHPVVRGVESFQLPSCLDGHEVCGYQAHVELITHDGAIVGGAVSECSFHDGTWAKRQDYALKSMAQTRATGKAYRMSFGFVMKAAGYEATPAEEMPRDDEAKSAAPPQARESAPDQRAAGFENVGAFLTTVQQEFKLDVADVRDIAGLPRNAKPERLLDHEGGLTGLYEEIVKRAPSGRRRADGRHARGSRGRGGRTAGGE